jgi:hypothetical protein
VGIGDDGYRDQAVRSASLSDLAGLVDGLGGAAGDAMYDWLAGPAADEPVTTEYAVFTAMMTKAADLAQLILDRAATQHTGAATNRATRDGVPPNRAG